MINLTNLSKTYFGRFGSHEALRDVNLHVERGDIFGIIGQSGAGKSTLVRCINLLERPTEGSVIIDGKDVTAYRGKELSQLRESIGMIFQNFSLFQQRTVLRNVTFPLELRREDKAAAEKRALELLELVGLADKAASYPSQLSGGQQQRVAIARALANNPEIMLCDEATSALDTMTTHAILDLLRDINKEFRSRWSRPRTPFPSPNRSQQGRRYRGGAIAEWERPMSVRQPQSDATRRLIAADSGLSVEEFEAARCNF
ncbi:MAG: methionine ABC transporter ATP-binding protein [Slackia sp.]